ncbi:uroporphyrinogen-III C-methyltransferase [Alicyclobacillus tolerans]|uniref:uroporphyrinogen-III C-methyltransferase n=2 Tax=Alicyclobacillus tolerans TaxID=90970 RepID=A0ABT9LS42_9BACL|nr:MULTISPECIES: uroporphyrinogen-III C-methyltransferase [Alicyclobacillus]MDP9727092.1 uroporphyrin-III C-methyltransferase [Alicyclobacillus tengchongensis]SHK74376.1 uroporphyrinogen III methyltransferase / synthase [Alicyclobacillus montanus]
MAGMVYLIGAGPGDPGLLTLKAKECLERSEVVIYDRLVSPEIMAFVPNHVERIYVGKEAHHHTLPQTEIETLLVEKALQGLTVSRLKGGDPFVYGRGGEEAEFLVDQGIPFEIVPGISSVIAVPAYAGIPLTHRTLSAGFHVLTGHECLYSSGTPWDAVALSGQTMVILMGMGHLQEIVQKLIDCGRHPETPVAIIQWGTTIKQQVVSGTLENICLLVEEARLQAPAVIVVGDVVRMREKLQWFQPSVEIAQ